jgi:hypothetical protein
VAALGEGVGCREPENRECGDYDNYNSFHCYPLRSQQDSLRASLNCMI